MSEERLQMTGIRSLGSQLYFLMESMPNEERRDLRTDLNDANI